MGGGPPPPPFWLRHCLYRYSTRYIHSYFDEVFLASSPRLNLALLLMTSLLYALFAARKKCDVMGHRKFFSVRRTILSFPEFLVWAVATHFLLTKRFDGGRATRLVHDPRLFKQREIPTRLNSEHTDHRRRKPCLKCVETPLNINILFFLNVHFLFILCRKNVVAIRIGRRVSWIRTSTIWMPCGMLQWRHGRWIQRYVRCGCCDAWICMYILVWP